MTFLTYVETCKPDTHLKAQQTNFSAAVLFSVGREGGAEDGAGHGDDEPTEPGDPPPDPPPAPPAPPAPPRPAQTCKPRGLVSVEVRGRDPRSCGPMSALRIAHKILSANRTQPRLQAATSTSQNAPYTGRRQTSGGVCRHAPSRPDLKLKLKQFALFSVYSTFVTQSMRAMEMTTCRHF